MLKVKETVLQQRRRGFQSCFGCADNMPNKSRQFHMTTHHTAHKTFNFKILIYAISQLKYYFMKVTMVIIATVECYSMLFEQWISNQYEKKEYNH